MTPDSRAVTIGTLGAHGNRLFVPLDEHLAAIQALKAGASAGAGEGQPWQPDVALAIEACRDETLPDGACRFAVLFCLVQQPPLTEADIKRAQELASEHPEWFAKSNPTASLAVSNQGFATISTADAGTIPGLYLPADAAPAAVPEPGETHDPELGRYLADIMTPRATDVPELLSLCLHAFNSESQQPYLCTRGCGYEMPHRTGLPEPQAPGGGEPFCQFCRSHAEDAFFAGVQRIILAALRRVQTPPSHASCDHAAARPITPAAHYCPTCGETLDATPQPAQE